MKENRKRYPIFFMIGTLLLWLVSQSTISAGVPRIYSPFSFTVVIPYLMLSSSFGSTNIDFVIATILIPIIFMLWSFHLFKGHQKIPIRTMIVSLLLIILSIVHLAFSWSFGTEYQGTTHTIIIYIYNMAIWLTLLALYVFNVKKNSYYTNYLFHWIFFAWLAWVAFPWLGELL